MSYVYLAIAIVAEVIATSALKASEQLSRLVPSVIVVTGYICSFYCLARVLNTIPVGVAYAIWSGLGIVLVAIVAAFLYRQVPDWPAVLGMAMIVGGVVVINVFSKMVNHLEPGSCVFQEKIKSESGSTTTEAGVTKRGR
jgi:small multidrug resistance pump